MADEEHGASSLPKPEQKSRLEDIAPVSVTDTPSTDSDLEFVDARERSGSGTTSKRSSFFDSQKAEIRPPTASSVSSQPAIREVRPPSRSSVVEQPVSWEIIPPTSSSISSQPGSRSKGKRPSVDFKEPPDAPATTATNRQSASRPVHFLATPESPPESPIAETIRPVQREPPPEPPVIATSSTDRPPHSRGNSYTNFSRPDTVRQNNAKSPTSPPGIIKNRNSITALPKRTSSISQTSLNRQNRISAASTVTSKRLRPPVHQADLERGNKTSSDESAPVPPFAQALPTDFLTGKKDDSEPKSSWLTELYVISYLIFFAFLGTLARLGLEWLTFYPGAIITTPVVWANFAGSAIIGFLVEDSRLVRDHWPEHFGSTSKAEKRISKQSTKSRRSAFSGDFDRLMRRERLKIKAKVPLYVGLTTGFCGCFTSFSLFARDMFLAVSNDLPAPPYQPNSPMVGYDYARSGGYSFEALLAVILTEIILSTGGFIAGRHMALLFEDYTPRIPMKLTQSLLNKLVVVLAWGCWLGSILLLIFPPDRPGGPDSAGSWANETWRGVTLFALVFCPLGCLLRYFMSKMLNKLEPSFPLGTFTVNMLGSAIVAACYDIQHIGIGDGNSIGGGMLSCQALEGIIDGFTGCLTTVSTFVAELDGLKRKYAWVYGVSTVVAGFSLMVVIMGPVRWTVGWSSPACVTGYVSKYS